MVVMTVVLVDNITDIATLLLEVLKNYFSTYIPYIPAPIPETG